MNMNIHRAGALALAAFGFAVFAGPASAKQSDAQVRRAIVENSIANYSGNCPCPYNRDRAGRSCGRRSPYSRPGGESPRCYASDVSAAEVAAYRRR